MIKIKVIRNPERQLLGLAVIGHAGFEESGADIVCAAVSILVQTAVYGLERYLDRDIKLDMAHGKLIFSLKGDPDELTEAILQTTLLGLRRIAGLYPQRVQILKK